MSARIRRCGPADLDDLLALEALFPGDRMSRRSLRRLLRSPSARIWAADVAERAACGALVLLLRRGSRVARIYSLVVAPAQRGRGVAQQLVRAAEREARAQGRAQMRLEVRADNVAARALYEGLGYGTLCELRDYYDDGADGLRLGKELG